MMIDSWLDKLLDRDALLGEIANRIRLGSLWVEYDRVCAVEDRECVSGLRQPRLGVITAND